LELAGLLLEVRRKHQQGRFMNQIPSRVLTILSSRQTPPRSPYDTLQLGDLEEPRQCIACSAAASPLAMESGIPTPDR
jgi:hypothetical protein